MFLPLWIPQVPETLPVSRMGRKHRLTQKLPTGSSRPQALPIRIPANTLAILGIAFSLAVIIAVVAAVKIHVRKKEEEDLYLRRQRRLERLEDIGFSSTDFEKLVAQRRISSSPLGEKGKKGRGRRRKKSFFR